MPVVNSGVSKKYLFLSPLLSQEYLPLTAFIPLARKLCGEKGDALLENFSKGKINQ
jgi:hypothetical protein